MFKMLRLLCVSFVCVPLALWAGQPPEGNALAIFNAFLARYAHEKIEWRAEMKLHRSKEPVPTGYLVGKSPLGEFTYRPKLFTELNQDDKRALMRDSRLSAFILSLRLAADGGPGAEPQPLKVQELAVTQTARQAVQSIIDTLPTGARRPEDVIHVIEISAEQILGDGPVRIYLP